MLEENVVSSVGTVHHLTLDEIKRGIRDAGWEPRQRNVFYQLIPERAPLPFPVSNPVSKSDHGMALPVL
jgi:cyclic dehypoxanthinyl futalosine synthase